jgi:hypothetical protein
MPRFSFNGDQMKVYKTKVFSCSSTGRLEREINEFLEWLPGNFVGDGINSIKIEYSSFIYGSPENESGCYSALILWEESK